HHTSRAEAQDQAHRHDARYAGTQAQATPVLTLDDRPQNMTERQAHGAQQQHLEYRAYPRNIRPERGRYSIGNRITTPASVLTKPVRTSPMWAWVREGCAWGGCHRCSGNMSHGAEPTAPRRCGSEHNVARRR